MNKLPFSDIELYSSIYDFIDSNMYLLISNNEAVIIDPHKNVQATELLKRNKIRKVVIMLTHEHPDHISGIWWYIENFDCQIICTEKCANKLADKRHTRPVLLNFILEADDIKNGTTRLKDFQKDYVWTTYTADVTFEDTFHFEWNNFSFVYKAIQGHSLGSCFIILNNKYVFTGDSLLKEYPIIVSFPQGNKDIYVNETIPIFEKMLKPEMQILPGHGTSFLLQEIMKEGKIYVELR